MDLTFSEKYALDERFRRSRLAAMGLSEDEHQIAGQLQRQVIRPHLEEIITQFFRVIRLDDQANQVFARGFREEKLKEFLANYLLNLGQDYSSPKYFEQRLRMGIAHINAGVDIVTFQIAYRLLQQLLIDRVPRDNVNFSFLIAFILKITNLDLIVATESFARYGFGNRTAESEKRALSRGSVQQVLDRHEIADLMANYINNDGSQHCIALARIDGFAQIKQCYGEQTAKEVKKGVSLRMVSTLRPGDGVGALKNDLYLFVFANTDLDAARDICQRVMLRIAQNPVSAEKMTIPVTVSLMLSLIEANQEPNEIFQRLSKGLLAQQKQGINRLGILGNETHFPDSTLSQQG